MQDLRAEPVAARSKAWICGLPLTGIVGTNTADGMDIYCECCVLSGRGLCDGLITRLDESYRLWCVVVCDIETVRARRPWLTGGCCAKTNNISNHSRILFSSTIQPEEGYLAGRNM